MSLFDISMLIVIWKMFPGAVMEVRCVSLMEQHAFSERSFKSPPKVNSLDFSFLMISPVGCFLFRALRI